MAHIDIIRFLSVGSGDIPGFRHEYIGMSI